MVHSVWVFLHLMLLVYWLGGDLGVFLLARAAKNPELSFAERAFSLRMAMDIDLIPRLCFTLMLPIGLHVTDTGGFALIPSWAFLMSWTISLVWVSLVFCIHFMQGKPAVTHLNYAHRGLQIALLVFIGSLGISALIGLGPLPGGWFGTKIFLFALIFALSIKIDLSFHPIFPAFIKLATEGSLPEIESSITRAIDEAIRYVLVLYILLITISFIGVTKSF